MINQSIPIVEFLMGRDSATLRDKDTEVPSLSRDKGTTGTSSKSCHGTGRAGAVCQNPGRDAGQHNHYFSAKIHDGMRDGTGQSLFFPTISCFRTSRGLAVSSILVHK